MGNLFETQMVEIDDLVMDIYNLADDEPNGARIKAVVQILRKKLGTYGEMETQLRKSMESLDGIIPE